MCVFYVRNFSSTLYVPAYKPNYEDGRNKVIICPHYMYNIYIYTLHVQYIYNIYIPLRVIMIEYIATLIVLDKNNTSKNKDKIL